MKPEASAGGHRLQITRVFDAPRQLVFSWWTKAEKLQQWSGCKEATTCKVQMDFREGGGFTQSMHLVTQHGECEFTVTGKYTEIVEPERIVYHANLGSTPTKVAVEFFEQGRGTKVVLTHEGFPDETSCKTVSQGTKESFDKLGSLLAGGMLVSHA